ncbi:MAG: hypothetical protein ACRCZS_28875 [Chroococcidiopsis sp.]
MNKTLLLLRRSHQSPSHGNYKPFRQCFARISSAQTEENIV